MFLLFGDYFGRFLIPMFRWQIEWLATGFHIVGLEAVSVAGALHAQLKVTPNGVLVVGGHVLYEASNLWPMTISTPIAQTFQSPLVLYCAALAWPTNSFLARVSLLIAASLFALILTMLDIPLILVGSVWSNLFDNFAPGTNSFLAQLPALISDGGRLAACVVAVALTISFGQIPFSALLRRRDGR